MFPPPPAPRPLRRVDRRMFAGLLIGAGCALSAPARAQLRAPSALSEGDPLGSLAWPDLRREFFGSTPVDFDDRVVVAGPRVAEDAANVPITVAADALPGVERIVVLVDRNPIRQVLEFVPSGVLPRVSLRLKLEQASAVRAIARTSDGRWHAGGVWVDTPGGGCTAPAASRHDGSWSRTLLQVSGRQFDAPGDPASGLSLIPGMERAASRLRVRVMHPMDTGLAGGLAAFHIDTLQVADLLGHVLLRMTLHEAVAENPVFSFDLPDRLRSRLVLTVTDNHGNHVQARIS